MATSGMTTAAETLNASLNTDAFKVIGTLGPPDGVVYGMILKLPDGRTVTIAAMLVHSQRHDEVNQTMHVSAVLEVHVHPS